MQWRFGKLRIRNIQGILLILILYMMAVSPIPTCAQAEQADLTGVKVAIYSGAGVMRSSRTACTKMFEWMNATVDSVNSIDVMNGTLDDYDIFVLPGGSETTASSELGSEGRAILKGFVREGGCYFGICGGATFGANHLRLWNGYMSQLTEVGGIIHMTTMHVNQSSTGPDLSDLPENFTTMFYASQYFVPRDGFDVHRIATYETNGEAGMVAFEYESGKVFLSSPHPEYEENSDRDDDDFGDSYDDPDSEWPLLLRVSRWLVDASVATSTSETTSETTTDVDTSSTNSLTTNTDLPTDMMFIGFASAGVIAVVVVVTIVYRRKGT